MKDKIMKGESRFKRILVLAVLLVLSAVSIVLTLTSIGADDARVIMEAKLGKYVNYKISEEDKGTLAQYEIRIGIENLQEGEQFTVKESETLINLNQVDGKYPYDVKVIAKSTKATNGKTSDIANDYSYDADNGNLVIRASNVNENGDKINSETINKDYRDEYSVICYYDAYTEENPEREMSFIMSSKYTFFEDNRVIDDEQTFSEQVTENNSDLTSVVYKAQDIYNGNIKSNIINNTDYNTQYSEIEQIVISKKEAQDKIEIGEENKLVRIVDDNQEDIDNNGNVVIKSTKVSKDNLTKVLGEDGSLEIFDLNGNQLATVNKETEWAEDGTYTINYEQEQEGIVIKTSEVKEEGILNLYNTKEIKSSMRDLNNVNVKTTIKLTGKNEEKIVEEVERDGNLEQEERIQEEVVFEKSEDKIVNIQDSQTSVTLDVNNTDWTNREQNEIAFNVYLNSNSTKNNMFRNPTIRIDLPGEVEKVILGESNIVYGNGLELQDVHVETNEFGAYSIIATVVGTQTSYNDNSLGLITDIQIPATLILKKDIENTKSNINMTYTNQFNVNGATEVGNVLVELNLDNYKEENNNSNQEDRVVYQEANRTVGAAISDEILSNIRTEISPVKGDVSLRDGDTVYEGEYIKYNIKVTNTSGSTIDNLKAVATIPEGTVYGELEADYNHYMGEYKYNFDDTVINKEITIGTLKAGETYTGFYEVKVNDLQDGEEEKEIITNIKTYIQDTEANSYEIRNTVNKADVKVFLGGFHDNEGDSWNYSLFVESDEDKEVEVKLALPEEYNLEFRVEAGSSEDGHQSVELHKDPNTSMLTDNIRTNTLYWYEGGFDSEKLMEKFDGGTVELFAVAAAISNNVEYQSNINRVNYELPKVSVAMTSVNEGEDVRYEDKINYEIVIKNESKPKLIEEDNNYNTIVVDVVDYLPEDVQPISMTYENWEAKDEDSNELEKREIVKNIRSDIEDEEGNELPDVDLTLNIPCGESVTLRLEVEAGFVYEKTKIENSVTVSGELINAKTSNVVSHFILPYNYDDKINPDGSDDTDDGDNPDQNNNGEKDDPSNVADEKYTISGMAWLDENEDGQRQTSETGINNVKVVLVNAENSNVVSDNINTSSDGTYNLKGIEKGKYIVVFKYDTDKYRPTEYQKSGVPSNINSDVTKEEITLQGNKQVVGATDVITLDASNSNIDIGLIRNKTCDLKLDKYISKVSVTTTKGTKEYNYNNQHLAKVEIKAKEIEGATVIVQYKIVVTNEGELPARVSKIIDYLPEGLTFSSELNKNWARQTNGQLIDVSNANKIINPGQSIETTLVLTKSMSSNTTGQYTNLAEIGEIKNSLAISDVDSTPGNKLEAEDDYSKADIIISISTGAVVYIGIVMIALILTVLILYVLIKFEIIKSNKIKSIIKIGSIVIIFSIAVGATVVKAATSISELPTNASVAKKNHYFQFNKTPWVSSHVNSYGSTEFYTYDKDKNGQIIGYALCQNAGAAAATGTYHYYSYDKSTRELYATRVEEEGEDIELSKTGTGNISVLNGATWEDDGYRLYGPFSIQCTEPYNDVNYTLEVWSNGGTKLDNKEYSIRYCESDGTIHTGLSDFFENNGRRATFYIRVGSNARKPISRVRLAATAPTKKRSTIKSYKANVTYEYARGYQRVKTEKKIDIGDVVKESDVKSSDKLTWRLTGGDIKIIKEDKDDNNIKLQHVYIYITNKTTIKDVNGEEFAAEEWQKTLETDANGECVFENLPTGTYILEEVDNTNYGYRTGNDSDISWSGATQDVYNKARAEITVNNGSVNVVTIKNGKHTGNLLVSKKDKDTKFPLSGVEFKLYEDSIGGRFYIQILNKNGKVVSRVNGSVYVYGFKATQNKNDATTFVTDEDGNFEIDNIMEGLYDIEEISLGNNKGYKLNGEYITWEGASKDYFDEFSANVLVTRKPGSQTKEDSDNRTYTNVICYNEKVYTDVSGYVWIDKAQGKGELGYTNRNDLYRVGENDTNDVPLKGVKVSLIDRRNGNVVKDEHGNDYIAYTSALGIYGDNGEYNTSGQQGAEYIFRDVLLRDIENYHVKFEYDGLTYTNVSPNQTYFIDNENQIVSKDKASKAAETDAERERFNNNFAYIENGFSKDENHNNKYSLTYSRGNGESIFKTEDFNRNYPNDKMYAYTYNVDEKLKGNQYNGDITYINLGLRSREKPQYELDKDLYSVKLSVNGTNHIYNYPDNTGNFEGDKNKYIPDENGFNVGVRWQRGQKPNSYYRAIYKTDAEYTTNETDKELQVYINYKIKLVNASQLTGKINNIVDYYDKRYESISVGKKLDDQAMILENININSIEDYNNKYKKATIDTSSIEIQGNTSEDIYVQFKLSREAVNRMLDNDNGGPELCQNIVEINSYTTYENGKIYAGIDKKSEPGNTIPDNPDTYEGDTSYAPTLKLQLAEDRLMRGTVFLDEADGLKLTTNNVRQGNGRYDTNTEKGIKDVDIELIETSGTGKIYTAKTDENGNFTIENFIPGTYILRYIWGNETYIVQNYKSTIVDENSWNNKLNDKYWYRNNTMKESVAVDDYDLREAIDHQIKTENNNLRELIKKAYDEEYSDIITKMESTTPSMKIEVENLSQCISDSGNNGRFKYEINDIDFGIVERARQQIAVNKQIENVKLVLANGQTVVELSRDEDGNLTGENKNTVYMKPSEKNYPNNGFLKLELDNELMQGARLEIEYSVAVKNDSEKDYSNIFFYMYGIGHGENANEVIKIKPSEVIDYLDNKWSFDTTNDTENSIWNLKNKNEVKSMLAEGVTNNLESKMILDTAGFNGLLEPKNGEIKNTIKVSKLISTTDKDIELNNEVETVVVEKTGGSLLQTIPGNYVPGSSEHEADDSMAETVTVTPNTGADRGYIMPIVISISMLILLGTGVFVIKKKILKND